MSINSSSCSCNDCNVAVGQSRKSTSENDSTIREKIFNNKKFVTVIIGLLLFTIALIFSFSFPVYFALLLVSYLLAGGEVVFKAIKNITKGEIFDENFLMSVATLGAFAIGEYPEAAAVMLFYQVGVLFEGAAVGRSKKSIESLMDIRPDYANLIIDSDYKKVSPENVSSGDIIMVRPGEKIPLDGQIIEGYSTADTSILTGESYPRDLKEGDEVLSGYINLNGLLKVKVTKEFEESTVSKILQLVQDAANKKAPTEKFITKFARIYTPLVVGAAVIIAVLPPLFLSDADFSQWLYRALVFLVISCPCALVVSIPMGFVGGIGKASRRGILVKGSNYLEALNSVDTVVFDKTGTITEGNFEVDELRPANGYSRGELLEYAASAEGVSFHPIAEAIKRAFISENAETLQSQNYKEYEEIAGRGIKVTYDDKHILVGNEKLMEEDALSDLEKKVTGTTAQNSTLVHVAVNGDYVGFVSVKDKLKESSKKAVKGLKERGIKEISILTGDRENAAFPLAKKLGIKEVYARLLPVDKLNKLEELFDKKEKESLFGKLLYIGDGINDAPVIARADIGVAMGKVGTDAAIESSDMVLMTDEPDKLLEAMDIARDTKRKVWQNIAMAFSVKGIVLILGAVGLATMWQAVIADVGVMVLAALNSLRLSF